MIYIVLGSISFIFFFLFDYFNIHNFTVGKNVSSLFGISLLLYSTAMLIINSYKIAILPFIKLISLFFTMLFGFLLVYSLFLELPFKNTYVDSSYNSNLVDTGTYALTRHPGVLWFFMFFLCLFLTTGQVLIVFAGIIWSIINILYVYLQEKLFFIKMFPDYKSYQKTTPMLLPNKSSIKKCILTFYIGGKKYE